MGSMNNIKRVAVIGAGPAGIAAVKYLKAERRFDKIVVFEQRDDVGGVWNYTPAVPKEHQSDLSIPRTKPADTVETPLRSANASGGATCVFPSPIYDSLETNIPHTLMNFSDKPFPKGCPIFPPFETVKHYLDEYAEDIADHLRLQSQVHRIVPLANADDKTGVRWKISYNNLRTAIDHTEIFDAVLCATGHYSDPFVPDIPGIRSFQDRHPCIISHSKYYKNPVKYSRKKVVIVGNSASGIDISRQISAVAAKVLVSEKDKPTALRSELGDISYVSEIAEFLVHDKAVRFVDGNTEKDIDHVIFCTGYQYSFPFLKGLDPPVSNTGSQTDSTYQHIFYYPQPTLAFLTLPQRIVPFPVAEAQAAYVARVFSGRLVLPDRATMETWEQETLSNRGGKHFHTLGFPDDVSYINELHELSMSAREGSGKTPPFWDDEKRWTRQQFPMIKQAALKLGSKRQQVICLADLGFDYQTWKSQQRLG